MRAALAAALTRLHNVEKDMLDDLERTHLKIDFAARFYNDVVHRYNRRWSKLPGVKPRETVKKIQALRALLEDDEEEQS